MEAGGNPSSEMTWEERMCWERTPNKSSWFSWQAECLPSMPKALDFISDFTQTRHGGTDLKFQHSGGGGGGSTLHGHMVTWRLAGLHRPCLKAETK